MGRRGIEIPVGAIFGLLKVTGPALAGDHGTKYPVECVCGVASCPYACHLVSGRTRSCGECLPRGLRTHGMSDYQEYGIWVQMCSRCQVKTNPRYHYYGGRGITVCKRWNSSFELFYADMGPRPSPKHSLERDDNDKGYSPGNCRWATRGVQMRNTRANLVVKAFGVTAPLAAHCEARNMPYELARSRIKYFGWDAERALTKPSRQAATVHKYSGTG